MGFNDEQLFCGMDGYENFSKYIRFKLPRKNRNKVAS